MSAVEDVLCLVATMPGGIDGAGDDELARHRTAHRRYEDELW